MRREMTRLLAEQQATRLNTEGRSPRTKRVQSGLVDIRHVGDAGMPADFLTKWSTGSKAKRSIRYVTNTWPGPEASSSTLETISLETLRQEVAALADDTMA